MIADSCNYPDECSVEMTDKAETMLFRLPIELRQRIYTLVLRQQSLVDFNFVRFPLDEWSRSEIPRPKAGKLCKSQESRYDKEIEIGPEEKQYESDSSDFSDMTVTSSLLSEDVRLGCSTGILGVSKTVSNEALDILYGHSVYILDIYREGYRALIKIGAANLRRIRYLCIVALPLGISYPKPLVMDPQLWLPLLEGLLQLYIVGRQPLEHQILYQILYRATTLQEALCEWTNWLDPILKYLSTNIPETTVVSLDDDGRAETTAIMEKHFGSRYQKVTTITGDVRMGRGKYAGESASYYY